MVSFARQHGIGMIAVRPHVTAIIEPPPRHLPQFALAESIRKQFTTSNSLRRQFYYNFPTHYLACAVCLAVWEQRFGVGAALIAELTPFVQILYPVMPRDFRPALRGAQQLGLVTILGKTVELSRLGRSCAALLPSPDRLAELHRQALKQPLATLCPQTGAVLRILLDHEPVAKFISDVLARVDRYHVMPMPVLVEHASRLDKTLTPVVFFFPDVVAALTDDQGCIVWRKVQAQHYRTTIYMQYKRILTHAGIIADHGLGGTSSIQYQPDKDHWERIV